MVDLFGRHQERRSRTRWSSDPRSGAGAATSSAATTSSTARSMAGASCPTARRTAAWTTCRWLLRGAASSAPTSISRRVIDVFTVHYYPQGGEFWPADDVSTAMQLRRNRSTRSLWDPNYTDETWINDQVQLIPRLRSLGEHLLLPRHADRHHRIQLGRREPHQRRHHAGGHLRHLRPRRPRHRRPLDDAGNDDADLQGDEDVSQLRRQPLDVRRHERARDVDGQRRHAVGLRRRAISATARSR